MVSGSASCPVNAQSSGSGQLLADPRGNFSHRVSGSVGWKAPLSVFVLALLFSLSNYFAFRHVHSTFMYDGWLYKWTIGRVSEFLLSLAHGQWHPALISDAPFCGRIINDGPVMSLFFGTIFAILGHPPSAEDWRTCIVIQSILHAASAALVMAISFRFHGSRLWSVVAGVLWAIYPAAIIAAGIFYTESLIVFLILVLVWAGARNNISARMAALTGLVGGTLFLAKPALGPLVLGLLVCTIAFAVGRRKTVAAIAIAGAVFVIGLWGGYTKVITGNFYVTTQRYTALNGAVGFDTESDGWIVSDSMPLTNLLMKSGPPGTGIIAQWTVHTRECLTLTARKLTRLFALPWNDFHDHVWGLQPEWLVLCHLLLFYLAVFGVSLYASNGWLMRSGESRVIGNASLICIGGHTIYMLFQTMERYAFTSAPFWMIFGGYGLWRVANSVNGSRSHKVYVAGCALTAVALSTLVISAANITRIGENAEIRHVLKPGATAVKEITFAPCRPPAAIAGAILMVDGDKNIEDATVEVNGHVVRQRLVPLLLTDSDDFTGYSSLATRSHALGIDAGDLRLWRRVVIPPDFIKLNGTNVIRIQQHSSVATIFGDSHPDNRRMAEPEGWIPEPLTVLEDHHQWLSPITTGHIKQSSTIEAAGTPGTQQLTDSLRIKLGLLPTGPGDNSQRGSALQAQNVASAVVGQARPGNDNAQGSASSAQPVVQVSLLNKNFDPILWWSKPDELGINPLTLKASRTTGCLVNIPRLPASPYIFVTFSGEVKAARENSPVSIVVDFFDKFGQFCILPATPDHLLAGRNWRRFQIADRIPTECLGKNYLDLVLFPDSWLEVSNYGCDRNASHAAFRNLSATFSADYTPTIQSSKCFFY